MAPGPTAGMEHDRRTRTWHIVALWVASRALVLLTLASAAPGEGGFGGRMMGVLAGRWDAEHYVALAIGGYPAQFPAAADAASHRWAFFPLFPAVTWALSTLTGWSAAAAAVTLNAALGPLAALLLHRWLRRRLDANQALLGVAGFAFWTHSYFFTYAYSEALFFVIYLVVLLALDGERPPSIGRMAALACAGALFGLSRPTSLIVSAALILSAMVAPSGQRLAARVSGALLLGAGVAGAHLAFSTGWCRIVTGVGDNCAWAAEVVGWGFGAPRLPWVLAHDVAELLTADEVPAWYPVRAWELGCVALCVVGSWLLARRSGAWGWLPAALMVVPVLSEVSAPTLRSVPRFLAATPPLFLLIGLVPPRRAPVVFAVLVVGQVASGAATALGVWQSF